MKVNNLKQFIEARGFGEESFEDIERNTYKYTDCGAWIQEKTEDRVDYESPHIEEFNDAPTYEHPIGLTVGSIVEGVDYDCTPVTVTYPFELDEFWQALQAVEDQVVRILEEQEREQQVEQHVIISWQDRHERIRSIADELDAYLERMQQDPWAMGERCRELHTLRGYCEQLRCDAESLKSGEDGFGKGMEEVQS
jgi:hypothetical protein